MPMASLDVTVSSASSTGSRLRATSTVSSPSGTSAVSATTR